MAVDPLLAPLLRVELFQGLRPLQITEIARNAERMVYRPGQTITTAGAEGDGAFLIVAGAAQWLKLANGEGEAEPIEIGSLIGEMAMLIEHNYGATVVATTAVRCLKLSREMMHRLMLDDDDLTERLTRRITARLARVADVLRSIDVDEGIEVNVTGYRPDDTNPGVLVPPQAH